MAATQMTQYKPPTRIEALRAMGRGDRIFTLVLGVFSVIAAANLALHVVAMIVTDNAGDWYDLITLLVAIFFFSATFSSDYWRYRARAAERHIATTAEQGRVVNGPITINGGVTEPTRNVKGLS
ncbi:hypothetical protein [Nocardia gipuzkoensis]|uniref:hypothetical protein n=1 Tax=Nocardia gipuzkoensis TaxID=2749991 RepID=UPI00237EC1A7|nr:hypothetical protein [Nocardia gipuzkoensis]MDE1673769.1 hypothetical protein [Nocardia gipuzkoensis]